MEQTAILIFDIFVAPIRDNAILVLAALAFTLLDFLVGFVGAVIRGEVSRKATEASSWASSPSWSWRACT